jgi:DNA polymerase-3 subunit beta
MQITIPTAVFANDLQTASRVASTRSAVQALSGIQIHADPDGHTELRTTDMEVALRLPLEASQQSSGTVVLPSRLLVDVVRSLSGPDVSLALRPVEQDVEITSGGAAFHLRTLRNEDFPHFPTAGAEDTITVDALPFIDTIQRVSRSASRDETRPVLTGILVWASDRDLRMVATDSYRLSVKTTQLATAVAQPIEANVPARALAELARIVQQSNADTITIDRGANQIVFAVEGAVLSSRLIDGQFPNYQLLLPDSAEHELRVDREELAEVVRRVSLMAQKNAPLRLAFSEGQVVVSAQTPDVGEAHEALPVPFAGEPFEIGFNADFLRDGLESVDSQEVVIKLTGPLRPGLIESADPPSEGAGGGEFVYLVMPIRLNT